MAPRFRIKPAYANTRRAVSDADGISLAGSKLPTKDASTWARSAVYTRAGGVRREKFVHS